jgi:hypothetical protein
LNISKPQQRTLHALARGGQITLERDDRGTLIEVECLTREGWRLADCTLDVFKALKRRRLIMSRDGGPYHPRRPAEASAAVGQPDFGAGVVTKVLLPSRKTEPGEGSKRIPLPLAGRG